MAKTYCAFLLVVLPFTSISQETVEDTTKKITLFPKSFGDKKWKFLIGLDARRSFFSSIPVKINGLKIGAEYKGVHRFGLGFYWLKKNLVFTDITVNQPDQAVEPEVRFDLGYSSLFYERVFLKTRWLEISFPFHLGGGSINASYRDTIGAMQFLFRKPFSAALLSSQIKFYPWPWIAFRVSGGYRITFNADKEVKQAFNQPFYGFGLSINIVGLYYAIFKRKNIKKMNKEELK
jgi:hypothetical protein